ncbi:MAG TPA: putative Ig domain-containing protein, partial [Gammaproteobacteria bacterium]|nr:putative Ig domain-containing protein [Gammaproteobacteria bacterium]
PKGAASVCLLISVSAFALAACGGGGGSGSSGTPASSGTTSPDKSGLDLPPTISGTPLNAIVYGRTYTFVPTAADPQGDAISFDIANKPDWASFDSGTGMLEGTPEAADVGNYPNITISATDGLYAVALRSFAISVVSSAAGSIVLSWDPPTQRDDGTPLTNLAGYRLHWGTALGHYPNLASIPNPGVATYVVDQLPSGTYYLVATAYDSTGMESGYSNVATETIP